MKILDSETGIAVEVPEEYLCADHEDGGEYQWTDGNYGCDCNRALFHARFQSAVEPKNPPCTEGRYVLVDAPWEEVENGA